MFNEVNTANRLRHPIRGRVVGFTTSTIIEFVNEGLTHSFPLYSGPKPAIGKGIAFSVELNGYLTFDAGAEIRILELSPYHRGHYSPNDFREVFAADKVPPIIQSVTSLTFIGTNVSDFNLTYLLDGKTFTDNYRFQPLVTPALAFYYYQKDFPIGTAYVPPISPAYKRAKTV